MLMREAAHTHTHTAECLCDGCILMRSNKDGNDPVHFSLSLTLGLCYSLSPPLPGTQLLVYMKPMGRVRCISFKEEKNQILPFVDSAQMYQSKSP